MFQQMAEKLLAKEAIAEGLVDNISGNNEKTHKKCYVEPSGMRDLEGVVAGHHTEELQATTKKATGQGLRTYHRQTGSSTIGTEPPHCRTTA